MQHVRLVVQQVLEAGWHVRLVVQQVLAPGRHVRSGGTAGCSQQGGMRALRTCRCWLLGGMGTRSVTVSWSRAPIGLIMETLNFRKLNNQTSCGNAQYASNPHRPCSRGRRGVGRFSRSAGAGGKAGTWIAGQKQGTEEFLRKNVEMCDMVVRDRGFPTKKCGNVQYASKGPRISHRKMWKCVVC